MNKHHLLNWKVFTAAGSILLAALVLLSAAGGPAQAGPALQTGILPVNSITVSGSGQAAGTPDVAYINLGVDTVGGGVSQAVNQANQTMAAIIEALAGRGIAAEDVQTLSFNVYPEDRYDAFQGGSTGERVYRVSNTLYVTVRDINRVSEVIQAALDAGANSINGLNFGIADARALQQEARVKAVADARERAARLAEALGVTLGEPIIISEGTGGGLFPAMYDTMAMGLGGGGPQITPGQLNINVSISVTFALGG